MMINEFNEKLGREVKLIDWDAIERVYMWHPAFDRTDAKKIAVELYKLLGVVPFLAMWDDATKAMQIQEEVTAAKQALESAKQKAEEFANLFR
jgi:hypothetical protein